MNVGSVFISGFVATVTLATIIAVAQGVGLTRINMPFILGTFFTSDRYRASWVGFVLYFVTGWMFATFYALVFENYGHVNWIVGSVCGVLHGAFVLTVLLPVLPGLHPRMASEKQGPTPTRALQPPGFLALHYGKQTPIATMIAHIAYGAVMGLMYRMH